VSNHGPKREEIFDSIVQEIDIPTGLVLFQWDSLDHVPITDSYAEVPSNSGGLIDYFHANSIDVDRDNNLVISARETWAAYKLNRRSGAMIWQLGGKHSSFTLERGAYWAFQHDVRVQSGKDMFITMFDNNAGPPTIHPQSRAIKLFVDLKHMTVRLVRQFLHVPPLLTAAQGNYQQLPDGHALVSWGSAGYITEFAKGKQLFNARFVTTNVTARAFRMPWSGAPTTRPAVSVAKRRRGSVVYVSWNGATDVSSWRVLAGPSASRLTVVRTAAIHGFETSIQIPPEAEVAVQALDPSGRVLGRSATVAVR
jgi:hypothetical protein